MQRIFPQWNKAPYIQNESMRRGSQERAFRGEGLLQYQESSPSKNATVSPCKSTREYFQATLNITTWLLQNDWRKIPEPEKKKEDKWKRRSKRTKRKKVYIKFVFFLCWLLLNKLLARPRMTLKHNWNSVLIYYLCIFTGYELIQKLKFKHTEPRNIKSKFSSMCEYFT